MFLRLCEEEETFEDLASSLSKGSKRQPKWRVGPIPMSRVPKPMFRVFQSISPGTLLEPIQIQKNWYVVRLDNYQPSEFDDAMSQRMCVELFHQHVSEAVNEQISITKSKLSNNHKS